MNLKTRWVIYIPGAKAETVTTAPSQRVADQVVEFFKTQFDSPAIVLQPGTELPEAVAVVTEIED